MLYNPARLFCITKNNLYNSFSICGYFCNIFLELYIVFFVCQQCILQACKYNTWPANFRSNSQLLLNLINYIDSPALVETKEILIVNIFKRYYNKTLIIFSEEILDYKKTKIEIFIIIIANYNIVLFDILSDLISKTINLISI